MQRQTQIAVGMVLLVAFAVKPGTLFSQAQAQGTVSLPDKNSPGSPSGGAPAVSIGVSPGSPIHGTNVRAAGGPFTNTQSELSYASSGPSIVLSFNDFDFSANGVGFATSTNDGITFSAKASPPTPAGSAPCCDPALVADLIGRFYLLQIFFNDGAGAGHCTNSLHVSTDGGQTFSSIVGSPFSYNFGTTDFPDMPHMAIDRLNLVGGQPQLYVFTRHFTSGINCPVTGSGGTVQGEVVCSTNGGTVWTAPTVLAPFTDNAHMAAGSDGSVYIVGNGSSGTILLRRSTNSCAAGIAFGAPTTVASGLTYGSVGIDREFPQPYVAVDKVNPNIAYVAWSSDRLANDGDRDIFLTRCTFSGTTGSCEAPVRVNDNPIGDGTAQYFPLLCVDPNNVINLAWNDQRAGSNSTAIFHTEVTASGAALSVGPSFLTSEVNFTPFDFPGTPDYGDYNENNDACDGQHFYVAWSSQVSPPGITPASNDIDVFFAVVNNLQIIKVQAPLDFGNVCTGVPQERTLNVFNVGDRTLTVSSVSRISGSTDITIDLNPTLPLTISPDASVGFTIRCNPTSFEAKTATIRITSNDPYHPQLDVVATCNAPAPVIKTTGSGTFGDVCAGTPSDKTIQVCDFPTVGGCGLNVTSATLGGCTDFALVNNPFPATVSDNSCLNLTVRFTPTSAGVKTCTLTITSNDPSTPTVTIPLTANTPGNVIDIPLDLGFPPTVIQSVGACSTAKPFPISNRGTCNLNINSVAVTTDAAEFGLSGLPSLSTPLQPGHVLGDGNLNAVFAPRNLARNDDGALTVTYESDPITHATGSVTRNLCGEGVRTGARVLVTVGGAPIATVARIHLQRITGNTVKDIVETVDDVMDVPLQSFTPAIAACAPFQFHREYGTVTNPIELMPGSYRLTVAAIVAGKRQEQTVAFDTTTCTFNPNIVVGF